MVHANFPIGFTIGFRATSLPQARDSFAVAVPTAESPPPREKPSADMLDTPPRRAWIATALGSVLIVGLFSARPAAPKVDRALPALNEQLCRNDGCIVPHTPARGTRTSSRDGRAERVLITSNC